MYARGIKVADFVVNEVQVTYGLQSGDLVVVAITQFMAENFKVELLEQLTANA